MNDERTPDVVTVAITRVDGGLTIMRLITTEYRPTSAEEKEAGLGHRIANWTREPTPAYIEEIIAKHNWPPHHQMVSWRLVPDDILDETNDWTFRDAWRDGGGRKPDIHMPKAREIQRERLRRLREPLLEALDVQYMQADEQGDPQEKKRISDRKQALRDVTVHPAIEAATTPDELKVAGLLVLADEPDR